MINPESDPGDRSSCVYTPTWLQNEGMSNVIRLGAYRRRRVKASLGKIGRDVLRGLGHVAFFLPGILISLAFLALRLTGIVDWRAKWLALPLLIDIGLWYACVRMLVLLKKALEHFHGPFPLKPLRPFRGVPA